MGQKSFNINNSFFMKKIGKSGIRRVNLESDSLTVDKITGLSVYSKRSNDFYVFCNMKYLFKPNRLKD